MFDYKKYEETQLEKDLIQLTSTPMGRRLFLASMGSMLVGCSSNRSKSAPNRHREGSNKGQKTSITVKDEIKMTKDYLPSMKKDYPAHKDPFLQKYLNEIGQKIVYANKLHNNPYQYSFTLVDSKQVNAFALPAGTVFVTAPLLAMADSEAELAGVIGHEIGHIKARHTAERLEAAKKEESKTWLYALGGGIVGGLAGAALAKTLCKPKDRECMDRVIKYGAIAGAGGGLLIQKYGFMANSREDEMEADRIGFKTAYIAGYSKDHVGSFYNKLYQMEKSHSGKQNGILKSVADAMSTHPPSKERITQMKEMAKGHKARGNDIVSSPNFIAAKKRLG